MEAIIDCLPLEVQKKISERLHLLAIVEEDKGEHLASYFSRALSGEPAPRNGELAQPIGYDASVESMLTDDYDFRDALRHQREPRGLLSAFIKPEDGVA
jgi:hypothetical protein